MTKPTRKTNRKLEKMERGQVLVLVALAIVGIVAMIGLTLDVGMMFIEDARLRRAVDAAALAAALQFREGIPTTQLRDAAEEFLLVNGVTLDPDHRPTVETCTEVQSMCDDPTTGLNILRKLVRVRATAKVHLAFLPVIGINTVDISAEATGESASLDLVLVLDTSESMTNAADKGDPLRDPTICNDEAKVEALGYPNDGIPGECHPFEEVKQAAVDFVDGLFFPYDRVSVVTFDKTATLQLDFDHNCPTPPCTPLNADAIKAEITGVIKNLTIYDANDYDPTSGVLLSNNFCPNGQPCRPYCTPANMPYCNDVTPQYWIAPTDPLAVYAGGFDCGLDASGHQYNILADPRDDPSQCSTTNIGGGLRAAGSAFGVAQRQASLFVVILLTDGAANSGTLADGSPTCPEPTWDIYRDHPAQAPLCRDSSSETRHCIPGPTFVTCQQNGNGLPSPFFQNGISDELNYDADDSAHDWADYVGINLNAAIFAIGMGDQVHQMDDAGGKLLTYAAQYVGNGQYYDASAANIGQIFKKIGDKIATRLAH